jgi:hypothetical protein
MKLFEFLWLYDSLQPGEGIPLAAVLLQYKQLEERDRL